MLSVPGTRLPVTTEPVSSHNDNHEDDLATALLQVTDLWERSRQAEELARRLLQARTAVLRVRRDAVQQLVREFRAPQVQVAQHLGLTKTRINQLVAPARVDGVAA